MKSEDDDAVNEVRRRILRDLVDKKAGGSIKSFADHVTLVTGERVADNYVWRMLLPTGAKHAKVIGEKMARRIEAAYDLAPGTLQMPVFDRPTGFAPSADDPRPVTPRGLRLVPIINDTTAAFTEDPASLLLPSPADAPSARIATMDPRAFILRVTDADMAPRYMPGEYALVEPGVTPELEDDVLVRLHPTPTQPAATFLARLVGQRHGWRFGFYANSTVRHCTQAEVAWVAYVAHPLPERKVSAAMPKPAS